MEKAKKHRNVNIILLIGSIKIISGNQTTLGRISTYFENSIIKDIDFFKSTSDLNLFILNNNIKCIIGIHALRCAHILNELCLVPYAIILGGTDINEYFRDVDKFNFMTRCLHHSKFIISFSNSMKDKFLQVWPLLISKRIFIIPQAVTLPTMNSDIVSYIDDHNIFLPNNHVFLIIAGIRPVKDPMYILEAFQDMAETSSLSLYLVIIGPEIDSEYYQKFVKLTQSLSRVKYLGKQPYNNTIYYLSKSFALINSSVSEGMPISILEAMNLNIPVLARKQDGNASLVMDRQTGFLYENPQKFIEKAQLLLNDKDLRQMLITKAKQMVITTHNFTIERTSYWQLQHDLLHN